MSFVRATSLYQAFFTQANKTPNSICIIDGNTKLSYRLLKLAIEELAIQLQQQGVK